MVVYKATCFVGDGHKPKKSCNGIAIHQAACRWDRDVSPHRLMPNSWTRHLGVAINPVKALKKVWYKVIKGMVRLMGL